MKATTLEKSIGAALAEHLRPLSFVQRGSRPSYVRATPLGKDAIMLNVARFDGVIHCAVHVGVRIEALEELLDLVRAPDFPAALRGTTAAFGCELGNLRDGRRRVWRIHDLVEVENSAVEMYGMIVEVGLPYFTNFRSLQEALLLARTDGDGASLVTPLQHVRAQAAIGLAFLLGDRAAYDEVLAAKRALLLTDRFGLEQFERFATILDSHW